MHFGKILHGFKSEKAQSLVEFAIVFPLLLLFLCIIIDFGRIIDAKIVLQSANSEGIRQVTSRTNVNGQVLNAISDYSDRLDFSKLHISSSSESTIKKTYKYHVKDDKNKFREVDSYYTYFDVTVNLAYDVPVIMPVSSWFIGDEFTVSSSYAAQVFLEGYPKGGK